MSHVPKPDPKVITEHRQRIEKEREAWRCLEALLFMDEETCINLKKEYPDLVKGLIYKLTKGE